MSNKAKIAKFGIQLDLDSGYNFTYRDYIDFIVTILRNRDINADQAGKGTNS